ncbi:MAG: response regulator [Candidatus Sericytochromatia bacterium]|nr:response regulator [Candidatus Sericytochromatia bacterium]
MRILIIDDEPDIRRLASISLRRYGGMEVLEAEDGATGLQLAIDAQPDAVLLDMMMPVMDGPETLAALRAHPATMTIPVVLLSARDLDHQRAFYQAQGALAIMAKPFNPLTLPGDLTALLGAG